MKRTYQWILKRAAALLMILALSVFIMSAALAASGDWEELQITISWVDENGETQTADAFSVTVSETGEGCFWVKLPADAPLDELIFSASHPEHELTFTPGEGNILNGVTDAGTVLDGSSYVPVTAIDPETGREVSA